MGKIKRLIKVLIWAFIYGFLLTLIILIQVFLVHPAVKDNPQYNIVTGFFTTILAIIILIAPIFILWCIIYYIMTGYAFKWIDDFYDSFFNIPFISKFSYWLDNDDSDYTDT